MKQRPGFSGLIPVIRGIAKNQLSNSEISPTPRFLLPDIECNGIFFDLEVSTKERLKVKSYFPCYIESG